MNAIRRTAASADLPAPRRGSRRVAALETLIDGLAILGSKHPGASPEVYGVDITRDVPYLPTGAAEHTLDVYTPQDRTGPLPVVLYVHGGGFRLLSKDTHWMMAVTFARRGYLVLNVNYRLAQTAPFPAAHEDVAAAWLWALDNVERLGGDPSRIIVAGESAGANLVTSLAIQTSAPRDELWARRVYNRGVQPAAVVGYSGIYEVSGISRLLAGRRFPGTVRAWVEGIETSYLGRARGDDQATELADPVRLLEQGIRLDRPLPPFFLSVGTADPLVDDSERLLTALTERAVAAELQVFEGEVHAFQMLTFRKAAKRSWSDTFAFLRLHGVDPVAATLPADAGLGERMRRWTRDRVLDVMAA